MPRGLQDRAAIVTGAARGIGGATAARLVEDGARVLLVDREPAVEATAAALGAPALVLDVTEPGAGERMVGAALSAFGRLDILVNNAGISGSAVGDDLSLEGWNRLMGINATGVFLGTTLAAQEMAKAGRGSIVNISSIMGFVGGPEGHPGYAASKGAVRLLTKAAAVRRGCG